MKLYQEAGVNPLMGCLPVVLQLPVFFALFSVLRAIAGWKPGQVPKYGLTYQMVESAQKATILGAKISDKFLFTGTLHVPATAKAVIFVAVLISMATTFLTVRQSMKRGMMPAATPDNPMGQSQKYMMYIMPVFALSGLYWQFGLVLYWVTTNLWTLGQQWVLFRRFPQPAAAGAAGTAGTATAPSSTARAVVTQRKRPTSRPTPSDASPPEDATPEDAPPQDARREDARREDAPRDRAGSNGGSKRNSNGAQPRSSSRRTTSSSPARSAPPAAAPSANGGGGMLRRLGKKNAAPEPAPEPEVKLVRQQRQRQSRSKRSGKR
jgi:YidC/Oxa1 family membrane protein insertase